MTHDRPGRRRVAVLVSILLAAGPVAAVPAPAAASPGDRTGAAVELQLRQQLATGGSTAFWVYLREQADLTPAARIADRATQGRLVHQRLTGTARASQAGLRALLDRAGADYQPYWIANAVRVVGDAALLERVAALPEVGQVTADRVYALPDPAPAADQPRVDSVEWGIDRIGAPQVWQEFGATGQGVVVATIDSGVQFDHPALVEQYLGNLGNGQFDHDYHWWDPSAVCGVPPAAPCDNIGHGTHVTGTMVGDDGAGNQIGVAPGARWIAAKGCETRGCSQQALLSAGQFILAPTDRLGQNPDPQRRPHIVNNSWGGAATTDPWFRPTVEAWVAAGIFPQFANGNTSLGTAPCGSASNPGNLPDSYAAGAFDINDTIARFSNRGPSAWGGDLVKPDIAAPGVAVRSAVPADGYLSNDGTSMASPHVAGAVALMWSAAPPLARDIVATRELLDLTAVDTEDLTCGGTPGDNNVWGQGRLDAYAAVAASPRGPTGVLTGVVTDAADGTPVAGATVTVDSDPPRQRTTGADGRYAVTLPVGDYPVTAAAFAFQDRTTPVRIVADQTTTQDFPLAALPGRRLHAAPDPLDAGEVPVAETGGPVSLTLTSTGSQPVTVTGVSTPGAGFRAAGGTCGSPPFRLSRLDSCTLDYTFRPLVVGPAETTVELASSDPDGPHRITLRGTATTAIGAERWVGRYVGPTEGNDVVHQAELSPDGATVYVTGQSLSEGPGNDYATVAYDTDSGEQQWVARYAGPAGTGGTDGRPNDLAVAPDGSRVYVTGRSAGRDSSNDYATVAYDAATGEELWVARYDGPLSLDDAALALDASDSAVVVTGTSRRVDSPTGTDLVTVAYDPATGQEQWVDRYDGPGGSTDQGQAVRMGADGGLAYVTGRSWGDGTGSNIATIAYDPVTGEHRWLARYGSRATAEALALTPGGDMLVVTGSSANPDTGEDYTTVAYDAATGDQRWVAHYDSPVREFQGDRASGIAVSPDGALVVVTGQSEGAFRRLDYATVAYDAATGQERWVGRYNGPGSRNDFARRVAVSPDSSRVYVTGSSTGDGTGQDIATLAYDAGTGAEAWIARYDGPVGAGEIGNALVVSPDGTQVYVAGGSQDDVTGHDFITVAYGAVAATLPCDRTITGWHLGPVTVRDELVCLDGALVLGPVRVHPGAALWSADATVAGPLAATGAVVLELTGTRLVGGVRATGTTGRLVLSGNLVIGPVRLSGNATGERPIVVSGNLVIGPLACTGNQPAPTNLGEPNRVAGPATGQCAGL